MRESVIERVRRSKRAKVKRGKDVAMREEGDKEGASRIQPNAPVCEMTHHTLLGPKGYPQA